jgi:hypothetical protein
MTSISASATSSSATTSELQMPASALIGAATSSTSNEISSYDWSMIDKESLDNKPVIHHPELGDVVEVRPGILAKRVSPEEQYQRHLGSFAGPRMPTEQLERRRFAMMMSAKNGGDAKFCDELALVSTLEQLDVTVADHMKNVRTMDDIVKDERNEEMLKHDEEESQRVFKALVDAGRVLKLESGETIVVNGKKQLTREAAERLRKDGYNVYVTRPPSEDTYMKDIRKKAEIAVSLVEGQMQLDSLKNGIDESTPQSVKEDLQVAVAAAAGAISKLEQEKNTITRHDGEEFCIRVNWDAFYKSLREEHVPTKDLREFLHEHGRKIAATMASLSRKCNEMLIFLECVDTALFVPRLYAAFIEQPTPRVIEFSRIYTVYFSLFSVLQSLPLLPKKSRLQAKIRSDKRKLEKLAQEGGGDVTFPSDRSDFGGPAWTQSHFSCEDVSAGFTRLRNNARKKLLESVGALHEWFNFEKKFHTGKIKTADRKITDPELMFTAAEVAFQPDILEFFFYRQLWLFSNTFCSELLLSYEFAILLMLNEYLPPQTADFWRSVLMIPENIQCPGVTKKLVCENNVKMFEWRSFDSDVIKNAMDVYMVAAPKLDAKYDDWNVSTEHNWSPTFKQMRKYHENMTSLFRLGADDVKKIVRDHRQNVRERDEEARQASLQEYLRAREASTNKQE